MTPHATSHQPVDPAEPARSDRPAGHIQPAAGAATVTLLLFAAAREAAGCSRCEMRAATVTEVLESARGRFGPGFAAILDRSRIWVNGDPVSGAEALHEGDEVAVLPPVSGG